MNSIWDDIWFKLFVPEGIIGIVVVSFLTALIGAWYGVRLAFNAERKESSRIDLEKYKKNIMALLYEASNNQVNIKKFQENIKPDRYVIVTLSTNMIDTFLSQRESFIYPDSTFIYFIRILKDKIREFELSYDFAVETFKRIGQFTEHDLKVIRGKAISVEACNSMVLSKVEKQAQIFNIRHEFVGNERDIQDEGALMVIKMSELKKNYGIDDD